MDTRLLILFGDPEFLPEVSEEMELNSDEFTKLPPVIENYFSVATDKKPSKSFSVVGCIAPPHLERDLIVNALKTANHCLEIAVFDAGKQCNFDELVHLAEKKIIQDVSDYLLDKVDPIVFKIIDGSLLNLDNLNIVVGISDNYNDSFCKSRRKRHALNQKIPVKCRKAYVNSGRYTWFNGRFYLRRG